MSGFLLLMCDACMGSGGRDDACPKCKGLGGVFVEVPDAEETE